MKITIIGYSGGGKTTLAKRISEKLHIPHQQIDRIWFNAGGHNVKTDEDKERVRKIILDKVTEFSTQNNWVSDGFYSRVQSVLADQADYVVVIEISLIRRLYNHWKRVLSKEDRHPEVTRLQDLMHSTEIIKRTFTFKPKLEAFKEKYEDKLVLLKNYKALNKFLETLETEECPKM